MRRFFRMFSNCLQIYALAAIVFLGLIGVVVTWPVALWAMGVTAAFALISTILYSIEEWIDG